MPRVAYEELGEFGVRLLIAEGAREPDARLIAEAAATTEAGGIHTHGLVILGAIDGAVAAGTIDPAARPSIVKQRGATATIDGNRCFSGIAMRMAIELAEAKAREHGIAMIGVRNTSWIAALGAYLLPLAKAGLFAQLWAQSSQCQDSVPVGGIDARFSTNPVALAFPTDGEPVLADFSSSIFSMGKVGAMARAGEKAAEPVFFDKDGNATDDPQAVVDGGSMLCAGGALNEHKGYALALWGEALTAMAGGNCNNPALEQRQNFNLTVIDPEAFADEPGYYKKEMARFISQVKTSRTRPGFSEIRLPGERMLRCVATSKADGVDVPDATLAKLDEVAARNNVEPVKRLA